jgi:hypothetical protein
MSTLDPLILDLLEWIGPSGRSYAEVIEAWRTSCPRLPVWEEANAQGFINQRHEPGQRCVVTLSDRGVEHLRKYRDRDRSA